MKKNMNAAGLFLLLLSALVAVVWVLMHRVRSRIDLVVARYMEGLAWLSQEPFCHASRVFVYNKGPPIDETVPLPRNARVIALPNVGRCDHTFLFHITHNYDGLAAVTIFVSGEADDPRKGPKIHRTFAAVMETGDSVFFGNVVENGVRNELYDFQIDRYLSQNEKNRIGEGGDTGMERAAVRPFGRWYDALWPGLHITVIVWYSIFAVHQRHIRQHPPSYYAALCRALAHHHNPEVGHYMERAWGAVFWPYPAACVHSV